MKLIVIDKADPSAGILESTYEITCPFERNEVDEHDLKDFKWIVTCLYSHFAVGKLQVLYDFEFN